MKFKKIFFNMNYCFLFFGNTVTSLGDWIQKIAITIYLFNESGSILDISIYYLLISIPDVILAPLIGDLIDRYNRKFILFISEITQGFLILSLILIQNQYLVMFILFIASIFKYFSIISIQSIIPEVVDDDKLLKANSLIWTTNSAMRIVGPTIAGLLMKVIGIRVIFIINAATFIVAGLLYLRLTIPSQPLKDKFVTGKTINWIKEYTEIFRMFIEEKKIFYTTVSFGCILLFCAPINSLIIQLSSLKFSDESVFTLFVTTMGAGYILGGVILNKCSHISNKMLIIAILFIAKGFIFISIPMTTQFIFLMYGMLFGTISCMINVLDETLVQEVTNASNRGRFFSIHNVTLDTAYILSIPLSGIFMQFFTPQSVYIVFGVFICLIGFAYLLMSKSIKNKVYENEYRM